MNFMPSRDKDGQFFFKMDAFASKTTVDGKSLYKRVHGKKFTVTGSATTTCLFTVPYAHAKVEAFEILNCAYDETVDFYVLDDTLGTYSGTPDKVLNQFGYTVQMPKDFYDKKSQYDADLYNGMQIKIDYTNNNATKDIYINYVLNEAKA